MGSVSTASAKAQALTLQQGQSTWPREGADGRAVTIVCQFDAEYELRCGANWFSQFAQLGWLVAIVAYKSSEGTKYWELGSL